MHIYNICLYREVCLSSRGFCLEGFVGGGFCPSPLLSEYIRYNRKLNILSILGFIYTKKFEKFDVTCSWTHPPPVTNCHTFSDPPLPLERDVLYRRPLLLL